jgi:leucyl aminopeptidase
MAIECLLAVDRHQGRLIFLEYKGEGEINTTALLVGKGITFDTGGLDIKGIKKIYFLQLNFKPYYLLFFQLVVLW